MTAGAGLQHTEIRLDTTYPARYTSAAMVRINKIYTKTGDAGQTGLADGTMVPKDDPRIEVCGGLDELNCCLGLARTIAVEKGRPDLAEMLALLQNELFDIGAFIASPPERQALVRAIEADQVERLEQAIDGIVAQLEPLRSFVLPGGTLLNSMLHLARSVCRRTERSLTSLSRQFEVPAEIKSYINRVSDLLFALAREESRASGTPEFLWQPRRVD